MKHSMILEHFLLFFYVVFKFDAYLLSASHYIYIVLFPDAILSPPAKCVHEITRSRKHVETA
jgi:hypothetical protein